MNPPKSILCRASLLIGILLLPLQGAAVQSIHWDAIEISVESSQPVEVKHLRIPRVDTFQRLEVRFSNPGEEPIVLQSIDIHVPFAHGLDPETSVIYGASAMGDGVHRETVSDEGNQRSSHMFAMVRRSNANYLFAGTLSWRVFMPIISANENGFRIQANAEGKHVQPGETVFFEALVFAETADWHDTLDQFGRAIARENRIRSVSQEEFTGWATWDYYSRLFRPEHVLGNMAALETLYPQANLIQMDGGWWTARGDYMSVRPYFEGGMKPLVDQIRATGRIAGLHFDGFRADLTSEIYRKHPEYFLHDQDGNIIYHTRRTPDVIMRTIYFDYSHPGARAYIQECIEAMKEWGITYFKVDFMRYGLNSEIKRANPSVESIRQYDPTITGVERFRLGMQAMREAIGEHYFLGCSAVFGPTIGFVDGMRTGGDIHPRYETFIKRAFENSSSYYLDGKVWRGDADYLVFREAADEDETVRQEPHKHGGTKTLNEAQMWADYNKLYGNIRLNSDNLMILRPERTEMFRKVLEWPAMDISVPVDLWKRGAHDSDAFELILASDDRAIFLGVFNWGDGSKEYDLSAFGLDAPVVLDGRHSTIIKYRGAKSFNEILDEFNGR